MPAYKYQFQQVRNPDSISRTPNALESLIGAIFVIADGRQGPAGRDGGGGQAAGGRPEGDGRGEGGGFRSTGHP